MTEKENILRAVRFENPEYIPMQFHINSACYHHYEHQALWDLMEIHPLLFSNFVRPGEAYTPIYQLNARKDAPYTDPWQCVWHTSDDGITGAVMGNSLQSWEEFDSYTAPNLAVTNGIYPIDWDQIRLDIEGKKSSDKVVIVGLPHGHTFLRLQDIRGYENLIFDMVDDEPHLQRLIEMVEDFNLKVIEKYLNLSPDIICYPEDLGMQVGPMLSPEYFRKFIKPSYQRLMQPARTAGTLIHMHSDGDIKTLVDDIIDGGVNILNLQDLVNGIDWIQDTLAGKVCIELDIDRQDITRFGTPVQIDALIRDEVKKLASPKGGLMMIFGMYPGMPLENANALMDAMEKYAGFYR